MIKAVITGDIIHSTRIGYRNRKHLLTALSESIEIFSRDIEIDMEIFRGDSFQIVVDDIKVAMGVAIAVRAKLISDTPKEGDLWDARLALGLGKVQFRGRSIATCDGDAYRYSGRAFDKLGKRKLVVASPYDDFNEDMYLITKFADNLISSWTARQAYVVYNEIITRKSQKELAACLGMTPQNLNFIWNISGCPLILEYINRYIDLVNKYIG